MVHGRTAGFTLAELMIAVVMVGVLAGLGAANYVAVKARAMDTMMKSDLAKTMVAITDYEIQKGALPPDVVSLEVVEGKQLSPNVSWDTFKPSVAASKMKIPSITMIVAHSQTSNKWQADYPFRGNKIWPAGSGGQGVEPKKRSRDSFKSSGSP